MLVLKKATDLLTSTEAGEILGVTRATVSALGISGVLKRVSPSGRQGPGAQQVYFRDDVEKLASDRTNRTAAKKAQRRVVTPEIIAFVKKNSGTIPARAMARSVGMPAHTIEMIRLKLGLAVPFRRDPTRRSRVIELHQSGLSAKQISREMKCSYNYISVILNNEIPQHALHLSRRKVQAAYSARGRTRWVESVREAHTVGDRYGLPSGLSPSQVRLVLELVNGPAASGELGRRVGLSRRTTGDHLRVLQVLGLVVIIDRFAFDRHDHKNLHRRVPSDYLLTGYCMDLLSRPTGVSP